jgi:HAD superfamily hydrolase (TIGR01549 family)
MGGAAQAILFDLHDTLVHLIPTTEKAMAAALGVSAERYSEAWGVIDDRIERGAWSPTRDDRWVDLYGELVDRLDLPFGAHELVDRFAALFRSANYKAFDEVPAALAGLVARGFRLGVLSNSDFPLEPILDGCGIGEFIEVAIPAVSHGTTKPRPEAFQLCCDALGIEPSDCWFVGDRLIDDVTASAALGMRAVLVDRLGRYEEQQLSFPRLRDLSDLPRIVSGS